MKRRDFIEKLGRGGLLAALAVVAGILLTRRQVVNDSECPADFRCRSCSRLSACQLPEAKTTREHGEEG